MTVWTNLLWLPKLVIRRERGVKQNSKRWSNDTRRMCEQWIEGDRGPYWQKPRTPSNANGTLNPKTPPQRRDAGERRPTFQGLVRHARRTPASHSEAVAKEMLACFLQPRAEDVIRRKLHPQALVSLATTPSLSLAQEVLLSFAPESAAGPSGRRPQHIMGGLLWLPRRAGAGPPRCGQHHGRRHNIESLAGHRFRRHATIPPPAAAGIRNHKRI